MRDRTANLITRAVKLGEVILKWDDRRHRDDWSGPSLNDILIEALLHERMLAFRSSRPQKRKKSGVSSTQMVSKNATTKRGRPDLLRPRILSRVEH